MVEEFLINLKYLILKLKITLLSYLLCISLRSATLCQAKSIPSFLHNNESTTGPIPHEGDSNE